MEAQLQAVAAADERTREYMTLIMDGCGGSLRGVRVNGSL